MDIIQRGKDDWKPSIGTETSPDLRVAKTKHVITWDAFTVPFPVAFTL
jgi:hypothetical protein